MKPSNENESSLAVLVTFAAFVAVQARQHTQSHANRREEVWQEASCASGLIRATASRCGKLSHRQASPDKCLNSTPSLATPTSPPQSPPLLLAPHPPQPPTLPTSPTNLHTCWLPTPKNPKPPHLPPKVEMPKTQVTQVNQANGAGECNQAFLSA